MQCQRVGNSHRDSASKGQRRKPRCDLARSTNALLPHFARIVPDFHWVHVRASGHGPVWIIGVTGHRGKDFVSTAARETDSSMQTCLRRPGQTDISNTIKSSQGCFLIDVARIFDIFQQ